MQIDFIDIINQHQIIPIVLYNKNDDIISDVCYTYKKQYQNLSKNYSGCLYVSLKDKAKKIEYIAKKIEFLLECVDDLIIEDPVKLTDGSFSKHKLSEIDKYLYWNDEEFENYEYINNHLVSDLTMNKFDDSYERVFNFKNPRNIETHFIDKNYCYFIGVDKSKILEKFVQVEVSNINSTNYIFSIKKQDLIDIDTNLSLVNINPELISIKDEEGNEYSFSYIWQINSIIITISNIKNDFENKKLSLIFKLNTMTLNKEELNIIPSKEEHPFITLYEDDVEVENDFYYIHNQKTGLTVDFYFKNVNQDKNYKFNVIDLNKIYDFNVKETNYFEKDVKFQINSYKNYDGVMPLNNYIINIKSNNELISSFVEEAKIYNQVNLRGVLPLSCYLTSASFIIPENKNYEVEINSIYKYKDYFDIVNLLSTTQYIDYGVSSLINYDLQFPYINFYGNFIDSLGNNLSSFFIDYPSVFFENKELYNNQNFNYINHLLKEKDYKLKLKNLNDERFTYEQIPSSEYNNDIRFDFGFKESYISNDYSLQSRNYSIKPGNYNVYLDLSGDIINDYGVLDISKVNESKGNFYGITFEWPYINFTGKVINKANGEVIHKNGMVVRLINNETTNNTDFTYILSNYRDIIVGDSSLSSSNNILEGYSAYKEDCSNNIFMRAGAWVNEFKFLFTGYNGCPFEYVSSGNYYYVKNTNTYKNYSGLNSAPSLVPGNYTVQLLDDNKNLISTYFTDFEISKDNQNKLYNYELEFPLCKFEGYLENSDGNIVYDNDYRILMENLDDSSKSVDFTFKIYNKNIGYRTTFKFDGLGNDYSEYLKDRLMNFPNDTATKRSINYVFFKEQDSDNPVRVGEMYYSKGLYPGNYKIRVYNKNRELQVENSSIVISKEQEANGELNNYKVKIKTEKAILSATIINDQYNIPIESIASSRVTLLEENYDGDLSDDFTDVNNQITGTFEGPDIIFENLNLGKYKINIYPGYKNRNYVYFNSGTIQPVDIKNLNDKSIFYPSGSENVSADIIDVENLSKDSGYNKGVVHVPYWLYFSGKKFQYVDEHLSSVWKIDYCDNYRDYFNYNIISVTSSIIKAENPYTKCSLNIYNNSLNESVDILSSAFSGYVKSGNISWNLKFNDCTLYTLNEDLSKSNEFQVISSSLNSDPLNMVVVIWREDLNKYQVLKEYYGDVDNYLDRNLKIELKYKQNIDDELSSYYNTDNKIINNFIKMQVNKDDNIYWQNKVLLPQLCKKGYYKYNIWYGGNNDSRHIAKLKGLYKLDISNNFSTSADILDSVSFDSLENYLNSNQEIDIERFKSGNSVKWSTLVVDELCMNIKVIIKVNDGDVNKLHNFAEFSNPLLLRIYDKENNLEKEIYNKSFMFIIPFLKSGYHKFIISMYEKVIYNKEFYIYCPDLIEVVIDRSNFVNVSGLLQFNNETPVDITHITVYNNDLSTYFYSGNHAYCQIPTTYDYSESNFNTNEAYKQRYTMNSYQLKYLSGISSIKYKDDNYSRSKYNDICYSYPTDKTYYNSDKEMLFEKYKLIDLVPGNYTIKYYVVPLIKQNSSSSYTDFDYGDSSIYYSLNYNISSYIINQDDLVIDGSELLIHNVADDISNYYCSGSQIDFEKLEPMRVILKYKADFYGQYDYSNNRVFNNLSTNIIPTIYDKWADSLDEGMWLNPDFTWERIDEKNYKIKIKNNQILNEQNDYVKNIYYSELIVVFGELINQQTVDISKNTTELSTINLDKMYSQHVQIKLTNINTSLIDKSSCYVKLFDINNNEINLNNTNYYLSKDRDYYTYSYSLSFNIFGLQCGNYIFKIYLKSTDEVMYQLNNLIVNDTLVVKEIDASISTYKVNLTFRDSSLNDEICTSEKYIRLYNDNDIIAELTVESSLSTILPSGQFDLLVHTSNYNYNYYYGMVSGDHIFNEAGGSSRNITCVSPLSSVVVSSDINMDIIIPYQYFYVKVSYFDLKSNSVIDPVSGINLNLIRISNNEEYVLSSSYCVKSGLYKISYQTTNTNTTDVNKLLISYETQYIDSVKAFTLYNNISVINDIKITLFEKDDINGAAITNNCQNKEVKICDKDGNIYKIVSSDVNGVINLASLPNIEYKLIIDGYADSNIYKLTNNNKNIKLIMDSSSKTLSMEIN